MAIIITDGKERGADKGKRESNGRFAKKTDLNTVAPHDSRNNLCVMSFSDEVPHHVRRRCAEYVNEVLNRDFDETTKPWFATDYRDKILLIGERLANMRLARILGEKNATITSMEERIKNLAALVDERDRQIHDLDLTAESKLNQTLAEKTDMQNTIDDLRKLSDKRLEDNRLLCKYHDFKLAESNNLGWFKCFMGFALGIAIAMLVSNIKVGKLF